MICIRLFRTDQIVETVQLPDGRELIRYANVAAATNFRLEAERRAAELASGSETKANDTEKSAAKAAEEEMDDDDDDDIQVVCQGCGDGAAPKNQNSQGE